MENFETFRLDQTGQQTQAILDQVSTNTADIAQLRALYEALTQSEPVIIQPSDTWPVADPEENVIYRVIDRVNTPPQSYSDYMWNGTAMVLMATYNNSIDNEPTPGSNNLVKSGGVAASIVFDISAYHATGSTLATYSNLAAALGTDGANVPASVRKGGMSVKFVQSSDHKYVQYRLVLNDWSSNTNYWICDDNHIYKPEWIDNTYIEKDTGKIISYPPGGFASSKLIPISPKHTYLLCGHPSDGSATCAVAFYDINGTFIDDIEATYGTVYDYTSFNIPSGTAFLRLCKSDNDFYIAVDNTALIYAEGLKEQIEILESKAVSLKEETDAIADYDKTYLKTAKVGELWNSSDCIDQGNHTLNGVYFDASRKFKKLTCSCGRTNDLDIKIVNLNTVQVIETIRKSGTAGVDIVVVPEDFQFDFDSNTTKIGIFIENAILGIENTKRVVPYKDSETEDLLSFSDGSTVLRTANYKIAMQFEIDEPIAIIREIENLKGGSSSDDLQSYININRDVKLGAGIYYIDNTITIPSGTKITGVRGSTIIKLRNATTCFNIGSQTDITIENITFEGTGAITPASISLSDVKNRVGEGTEVGIYVSGSPKSIFINNCRFKNFDLAGIQIYRASGDLTECCKITDCVFVNNWYGLLSDVRSEYHTVVGCSFNTNEIGCYIAGGNNYMSCCHFDENAVGCVISGTLGDNDSHGSIGTSSFNHNTVYSLCCIDVNNGFVFTGFGIYDGNIVIENSKSLLFDGGAIAAAIDYTNAPASQICMISNCLFYKVYGGGTISDTTRLLLKNNHFADGTDSSSINN